DVARELDGVLRGHHRVLGSRAKRTVRLREEHPDSLANATLGNVRSDGVHGPTASTMPAPSESGITRGKGISDPKEPARFPRSLTYRPTRRPSREVRPARAPE